MRCRLCTTNDKEALAEQLAAEMWNSRRDHQMDPPWEGAGDYWQSIFRHFAQTTIAMLERDHR